MTTTQLANEPSGTEQPIMFTERQVAEALNHAADDILDAVDAPDSGLRDAMNLIVNATVAYLTGQARDLQDVVASCYDAPYAEVLSWIEEVL